MSTILVVAEHRGGALRDATLEAMGAALGLAQAGGHQVVTALLADDPASLAGPLMNRTHGLKQVAHADLANYNPELYLPVLSDMVSALEPVAVLMAHTSQGMDLGPALAGRLGLPAITDCSAVEASEGAFKVRRQVYAGKVSEELRLKPAATWVITLQGGAFEPAAEGAAATEVEDVTLTDLTPAHDRVFLEYLEAALDDVDIAAADILVSVGRGIGGPDNIPLAEALAEKLGATVSCSRPVADQGWLPKTRQVGTSGKTVKPKIYIALGISGAFQHQAGMKNSGTIIAVNKDPRAPIFQVAHYGIVDDLFKVLPVLTERFAA